MDHSGELISVVMPARNAEKYIRRTLLSVLRQTHSDLEIIVIDDGSTDSTVNEISAAADGDPRVKIYSAPRRGVSAARNYGISLARSEFIATIDADDLWTSDKLVRQLRLLLTASPEVGCAYCWAAGIDEQDRIVLPAWSRSVAEGNVLHDVVEYGILSNGSTPLFRKSAFRAAGGYDEALALSEDWKFYTALAGVCRFAVIPECLTGYRIRDDSSSVNVAAMDRAIDGVTQWIAASWPEIPARVFRKRSYTVNIYLAFLSIRSCNYAAAMRYLARASAIKPLALIDGSIMQFIALAIGHRFGLRRYEWKLWRAPRPFLV